MKNVRILLVALLACVGTTAVAQDFSNDAQYGKYGATVEERKENIYALNFFSEACGNKDYPRAAGFLKHLLEKCPKASENIYIHGTNMFKARIARAQSVEEKNILVDSLMLLYDLRVENFGDHATRGKAYILDRKARDLATYKPMDHEAILKTFREALDAGGNAELALVYYSLMVDYYNTYDEVHPDELIAEYDRLSPLFDTAEGSSLRGQFDALFGASGAASCENLERIFKAKLESNPDDEATLAQAVSLMGRAKCNSDFYLATAEKYYALKPSSEAAMSLAQAFQNKQNFEKAGLYLREALETETDNVEREKLLVRLGLVCLASKDYAAAREAANAAKALNAEDGLVYFVLGQCYAAQASVDSFEQQTIYWVAYDTISKAVNLLEDADLKEVARQLANSYRAAFPSQEDCFFNELKEGQSYTAAGVATTVRYR